MTCGSTSIASAVRCWFYNKKSARLTGSTFSNTLENLQTIIYKITPPKRCVWKMQKNVRKNLHNSKKSSTFGTQIINCSNFEGTDTASPSHLEATFAVSCNWHLISPKLINMRAYYFFCPNYLHN